MADPVRIYWDACVWIALINEEPGRIDSAKWVVERAQSGEVEIWTSMITLAEVFKTKCAGDTREMEAARDKNFEALLAQDFVVLVQVDSDIATDARQAAYPVVPGRPTRSMVAPRGRHMATVATGTTVAAAPQDRNRHAVRWLRPLVSASLAPASVSKLYKLRNLGQRDKPPRQSGARRKSC